MEEAVIRNALDPMARVAGAIEQQLRDLRSYDQEVEIDLAALDGSLALGVFNVHLLGRAQIWAEVTAPADKTPSALSSIYAAYRRVLAAALGDFNFQPLPFDEAIDFFKDKTNLSPEEFYNLADQARSKAFSIRVGATEQIRSTIKDLLTQAQSDGIGVGDFRDQAQSVIERAGIGMRDVNGEPMNPDWYWTTVFKTNLDTSYQAGRWQQMTDPEVVDARPYLRYVSALLPTSRPSHREKHGVILPVDDPFWDQWMPPNGFNCYCTVTSVSQDLLKRRGWSVTESTSFVYPTPDKGFAGNPGKTEAI